MDDTSLGVVEILLAFGVVLALATREVIRNRRALVELRKRTDDVGR